MTATEQMRVAVPIAVCVGAAIASYAALIRYRQRKWRIGGKIKKLMIYPIKSLPPLEVEAADLTLDGLKYKGTKDREFLLLDADDGNKFITARTEPSLLLIHLSYDTERNCLRIRSNDPQKNLDILEVPLGSNEGVDTSRVLQVRTWDRNGPYEAYACDEKVRAWFSKYLNKNVLVVRLKVLSKLGTIESPARFQDMAVLNILSDRSVENLVALIRDPSANVTFRNFRPNILLETKYPHEEDFWVRVKIGNAETEFQRRTTRCQLTTINPESGLKTDKEPLVTLRKYVSACMQLVKFTRLGRFRVERSAFGISKYNFMPLFACHHYIRSPDTIYVGQTVLVEESARDLLGVYDCYLTRSSRLFMLFERLATVPPLPHRKRDESFWAVERLEIEVRMGTAVNNIPLLPASLCVASAAAILFLYQNRKRRAGPLEEGGKIKRIFIYPIKSVPPIEVSSADINIDGVSYKSVKDREFVLIDAEGTFLTGRQEPTLSLLHTEFNEADNCLEISSKNPDSLMELLKIKLDHEQEKPQRTLQLTTWYKDHPYSATYVDDAVSDWFSRYLKRKVSVVRLISLVGKRHWIAPDRFQDASELNILSQASVDNLVEMLKDAESANISHRNFRPSLLVETKYPFEEDFWTRMVIGDVETEFHTRCERCLLTTINPDSGIRTDKEPLTTLRKYRIDRSAEGLIKYKMRPLLACNHSITKAGTVHVGQTIMVHKAPREIL
ncbi:uncharacterized protein LOC100902453 [Galendromus occidentalis]|uniref:Uncharacterized protein LOC100902453 n=1 Tax=Galendromus occidentalis TaxID=34638 RepID=A0AAJ6QTA2_9ACAR|nr:uncharacterized protein LOC100902453 [Galendromus occidentalis]